MRKEQIVVEYMYFRFPSNYAIMVIPTIFAVVNFFLFEQNISFDGDLINTVSGLQKQSVANYLSTIKVTSAIVISFFITFRWSSSHKDGSYGYFLTQGIDRNKYFNLSIFYALGSTFGVSVIGLFIVVYFGGLSFPFFDMLLIIVSLFLILSLIITLAIFIAHVVKIPELATMIVGILIIVSSNFYSKEDQFVSRVLNPDLNVNHSNPILSMTATFVLSFGLYVISNKLHLNIDVEL